MSNEPVYFVVERGPIGDVPVLYHGYLPPSRNGQRVYELRLDTLSSGNQWLVKPLSELAETYAKLRDAGKLPKSI